jgi:hypothetical protein
MIIKIDPKPKLIERCYDCSEFCWTADMCLKYHREVENCNIIPDWCELEDYEEGGI